MCMDGDPQFWDITFLMLPSCGSESCMSRGCQIMSILLCHVLWAMSCLQWCYIFMMLIPVTVNIVANPRVHRYANNFGSLLFVKVTCMLFPDVLFMNVLLTLLPIVANWLLWKKDLWLSHVTSMATHWIVNLIEQFQQRGCYFFQQGLP